MIKKKAKTISLHAEIKRLEAEIGRLRTLADTRDMMLAQLRAQFDDMVRQRDRALEERKSIL